MTPQEIVTNLEQDYYNGQTPENSVSKRIIPASRVMGAEFEYLEVEIDGVNRLFISTPAKVSNGPGAKFKAVQS